MVDQGRGTVTFGDNGFRIRHPRMLLKIGDRSMPRGIWLASTAALLISTQTGYAQQASSQPLDLSVQTIGTSPVVTETISTESIAVKVLGAPESSAVDLQKAPDAAAR